MLIAGGASTFNGPVHVLGVAELYEPRTGTWHSTGRMHAARWQHAAIRLRTGEVPVEGGFSSAGVELASADLYDPRSGTWRATARMCHGCGRSTATLLADGEVLGTGGITEGKTPFEMVVLRSAEMYHAPAAR